MRGLNFKTAEREPVTGKRRQVCRPNPTFKLSPEQPMHNSVGIEKAKEFVSLVWDSVRYGKRKKPYYYCKKHRMYNDGYRAVVGRMNYYVKFGFRVPNADHSRWQEEIKAFCGTLGNSEAISPLKPRFSSRGDTLFITFQVPERFWNEWMDMKSRDSPDFSAPSQTPGDLHVVQAPEHEMPRAAPAASEPVSRVLHFPYSIGNRSVRAAENQVVSAQINSHANKVTAESDGATNSAIRNFQASAAQPASQPSLAPAFDSDFAPNPQTQSGARQESSGSGEAAGLQVRIGAMRNPVVMRHETRAGNPEAATGAHVRWHPAPRADCAAGKGHGSARAATAMAEAIFNSANSQSSGNGADGFEPAPAHQARNAASRGRPIGYISSRALRRITPKRVVGAEALPE